MATGGKRDEVDAKIKAWERELERVRVALGRGPESIHARYSPRFVEVYQAKEVVKSRWEAIRGVYGPEPADVERFHEALASMEKAWATAQPMFADVLKPMAA